MEKGFIKKRLEFYKIARDIKRIKIQGARNIAKKALYAYSLVPTKKAKKKLMSLRPTEPMLVNVLNRTETQSYEDILKHFDSAQEKINKIVFRLIKNNEIIYTHCHSTNVSHSLIYAKNNYKKFEVYNTETRPLFQGRKTAQELTDAKIKVTMFIDSALSIALSKKQGTKSVTKIFLGADALLKEGIINKIGSGLIAQIAKNQKIPVYIIADSWKFTTKAIKIEQRNLNEIWDNAPKKVKIQNPAFEFVDKKYITGIVSELGLLNYDNFVKKMMKE